MGNYGSGTLENDVAQDLLDRLDQKFDLRLINSIFSRFVKEQDNIIEAVSAAEVIAAIRGFPSVQFPAELALSALQKRTKLEEDSLKIAIFVVELLIKNQKQHITWVDNTFETEWFKELHDLLSRLQQPEKEMEKNKTNELKFASLKISGTHGLNKAKSLIVAEKSLETIELECLKGIDISKLAAALSTLKNFSKLIIKGCYGPLGCFCGLSAVVEIIGLKELKIETEKILEDFPLVSSVIEALELTNVTLQNSKLDLCGWKSLKSAKLGLPDAEILSFPSGLQDLKLSCEKVNKIQFEAIYELRSLYLIDMPKIDITFSKAISLLEVQCCFLETVPSRDFFEHLAQAPMLKTLNIIGLSTICNPTTLASFKGHPQLKSLKVSKAILGNSSTNEWSRELKVLVKEL